MRNEKGEGSLYRRKGILNNVCMCDTCHTQNISFALGSKKVREQNFGHNKKRAKRGDKKFFFGEKMEENRGFYGRVWD